MIEKLQNYFGFVKDKEIDAVYPDSFDLRDNLDLKIEYLKALDDRENERRTSIDTKTSQLIGQTAIIFSIVSLFISNFISKFGTWPLLVQVLLISVFMLTLWLYLMTIIKATEYLNIHKYSYGQRSTTTVSKIFETSEDFQIEEIKDVIYAIERNTQVTNLKCNNLVYAHRFFRFGTIMVGVLAGLMILTAYITPAKQDTVIKIDQPLKVEHMDSISNYIKQLSGKLPSAKPAAPIDTARKPVTAN